MRWSCMLWWLLTEMISITTLAEKRKLPTTPSETVDGQELLQHLQQKKSKPVETTVNNKEKTGGLVVIPGLGRADRLDTVLHNLRMLASGGYLIKRIGKKNRPSQKNNRQDDLQQWDCVIYIYAERNDVKTADFFAETDKLSLLAKYCELREYPNQFVTTNMWMVKPKDIIGKYSHVFVLLDDIKLLPSQTAQHPSQIPSQTSRQVPSQISTRQLLSSQSQRPRQTPSSSASSSSSSSSSSSARTKNKNRLKAVKFFDLSLLLSIMQRNNLTAASPMVIGANTGGGQAFRTIMQRPPIVGTQGYISVFVELFAWMGTASAYIALWEILYPSVNPFGWGHDFWYPKYGLANVPNHKTGIISVLKVAHIQDFSAPNGGRTDITSVADKWGAVLAQERFYKTHFQINLKQCREQLGLHNNSWNGAVMGYLY